jgi:Nucleoside 2-deoxyribosyltransferase like
MRYIEAFSTEVENWYFRESKTETSIFLGGGISNCENWQERIVEAVKNEVIKKASYPRCHVRDLVLINPRRENFNVNDPNESVRQIEWEHAHLKSADTILFWFCEETLCPITLFEYGKWLVSDKKLIVGCHPNYKRKQDVIIQTRLERPSQKIYSSVNELISAIIS